MLEGYWLVIDFWRRRGERKGEMIWDERFTGEAAAHCEAKLRMLRRGTTSG